MEAGGGGGAGVVPAPPLRLVQMLLKTDAIDNSWSSTSQVCLFIGSSKALIPMSHNIMIDKMIVHGVIIM